MTFGNMKSLFRQRPRPALPPPQIKAELPAASPRTELIAPVANALVLAGAPPLALLPATPIVVANKSMNPNNGLADMLQALRAFLPAAVAPLPDPSVSLLSVTERPVGIGNRRGEDLRSGFDVIALKGTRLAAVVRFQLWADQLSKVDKAIEDLNTALLSSRDQLRATGFLEFSLGAGAAGENIAGTGFRETVDYRILYEHQFEDNDGADSLLASIPVHINSVFNQSTLVTDGMARWDEVEAIGLAVRGPLAVGGLTGLFFLEAPPPSGTVTITRTFDGAPPPDAKDLGGFLAAVTGPAPASRNTRVTFASVTDFRNAFTTAGDPAPLGGNLYQAKELLFQPPLQLSKVTDRFEVSYQNPSFDHPSVVYLRAVKG